MNPNFGRPSMLFKIVPVFITLVAMIIFIKVIFSLFRKKGDTYTGGAVHTEEFPGKDRPEARTADMKCPKCGGLCEDGTDVSPSGDIKCEYCNAWFNVWNNSR